MSHEILVVAREHAGLHRHRVIHVCCPHIWPEGEGGQRQQHHDRHHGGDDCAPTPGQREHEGQKYAHLRLDAENAEQGAGEDGTTIERNKAANEQGGDQKAVLPAPDVYGYGGRKDEKHEVVCTALATGDHHKIHDQSRHAVKDISHHVRHESEWPGEQQEMRRIGPNMQRILPTKLLRQ
jgi:hypothetical protein